MKMCHIKGDKIARGLAALALTLIAVAVFSGCGGRAEGETAVSEAPVQPTATIAVTASAVSAPLATPTPTPEPVPTPTLTPTPEPTPTLAPTPTAVPTATPAPPPTPTPAQFRPVDPPELVDLPGAAGGAPIFQVSRLNINGRILSLAGTVTDRPDLAAERWTVQVWQSRYEMEPSGDCTTEKPVAFIMPPSGSGNAFVPAATPYQWTYCIQGQGYSRETNVPWLRATSWKLAERDRRYIFEPRVWEFNMTADLQDERVRNLEYASPAGWTVLVWAGDTLVAREWVGF